MRSHLTADTALGDPSLREIAELKVWCRRTRRQDLRTQRQKLRALLDLTLAPWRTAKATVQVSREYGPFVARQFGVPRHRQLLHVYCGAVRYGLEPIAYYRLQLFRPERWAVADRFVQSIHTGPLLRWLVAHTPGYPRVFGDKRAFEAWCAEHGLPAVATLMEFEEGRATRSLAPGGTLPGADLFSKPSNWHGGRGAQQWTFAGTDRYIGSDGRVRDTASLVSELARASADLGRPIVLQRQLRNASSVANLTTGALCTARIATIGPPGGDVQVLLGLFRMPTGTAIADNFSVGGLAAPIDVMTGRLGRAIRKDLRLLPVATDRHPDTDALIEGFLVPHWPEAVSLVLRAHAAISWKGVPVVGWDVAILEEGPVLLEGNNIPCSTGTQMITTVPLGATPFVACVNAHLREHFAPATAGR